MGALNQQSIRHSHYVKKHAEQTENVVVHFHTVLHLYHKASNQLLWMEYDIYYQVETASIHQCQETVHRFNLNTHSRMPAESIADYVAALRAFALNSARTFGRDVMVSE